MNKDRGKIKISTLVSIVCISIMLSVLCELLVSNGLYLLIDYLSADKDNHYISYATQDLKIENYNVYANVLTSTSNDGKLVAANGYTGYVDSVTVVFGQELEEDLNVDVYYANNEGLSEDRKVAATAHTGDKECTLVLDQYVTDLRFDLGDQVGQTFSFNSINLSTSKKNSDPVVFYLQDLKITDYLIGNAMLVSTTDDGKLSPSNINTYVRDVTIQFSRPLDEDLNVSVYYANNEELSENNKVSRAACTGATECRLNIGQNVTRIRFDLGDQEGQTFYLKNITIDTQRKLSFSVIRFLILLAFIAFLDVFIWGKGKCSLYSLRKRRGGSSSLIVVLSFLLAIYIPLLTMNKESNKISVSENRYLAEFPQIFNSDGSLSDNLYNDFKSWISDNLGFRDNFISLSKTIKLNLFNISPTDRVQIGKKGWLYYTGDNNIEIASGDYPLSNDALTTIAEQQTKISGELQSAGISYALILPASKVSIYPENIESGDYFVQKTPIDSVYDYLKKETNVNVIELKSRMLEEKKNQQVYYTTDSHWNYVGTYFGCLEIISELKEMGLMESNIETAKVQYITTERLCDLENMMGGEKKESAQKTKVVNPSARLVTDGSVYEEVTTLASQQGYKAIVYENEKSLGPKVLMFHDSMFDSNTNAPEILAQSCSTLVMVYGVDNITSAYIEAAHPDVVLFETGERLLSYLSSRNIDFSK